MRPIPEPDLPPGFMEEEHNSNEKENALCGRSLTAASRDGGGRMPAAPLAQGKVERGKVYSGDGELVKVTFCMVCSATELGQKSVWNRGGPGETL